MPDNDTRLIQPDSQPAEPEIDEMVAKAVESALSDTSGAVDVSAGTLSEATDTLPDETAAKGIKTAAEPEAKHAAATSAAPPATQQPIVAAPAGIPPQDSLQKPQYGAPNAVSPASDYQPQYSAPNPVSPAPVYQPQYGAPNTVQPARAYQPQYSAPNTVQPAPAYQPQYNAPNAGQPAPTVRPVYGAPLQAGYPAQQPYRGPMPNAQTGYPPAQFAPQTASRPLSPYPNQTAAPAEPSQNRPNNLMLPSVNRQDLDKPAAPEAAATCDRICAGFLPRLSAFIFDCALVMLPWLAIWFSVRNSQLGNTLSQAVLFSFSGFALLRYLLLALYFTIITATTGTTVGKKLMRLRVVRVDGSRASWGAVLYRETIGRVLSTFLCIGYLVLAADHQHRGFHDMLADTRVVFDM